MVDEDDAGDRWELPPLPVPEFVLAADREVVIDRPVRGTMNVDLRAESLRLYGLGYPIGEIAGKLGRPTSDIRRWIKEALRDYVATPETVNVIRGRQLLQVETTLRRVFEIMEAAGLSELGLKAVDRVVRLLQHESAIAQLDRDATRGDEVDPIDASLRDRLEAARRRAAETEQRLTGEDP